MDLTERREKMGTIVKANSLRNRGLPDSSIRQMCHMVGSPFFQKVAGGTWWVDESKLDKWLDRLAGYKEEKHETYQFD